MVAGENQLSQVVLDLCKSALAFCIRAHMQVCTHTHLRMCEKQVSIILKTTHTSSKSIPIRYSTLTCQSKAQLLVSADVYRSTLLAERKTLHALGLQVPEADGAAGRSYCPSKQCSESRHRQTRELCGLLLLPQLHCLPWPSWITALDVLLEKSTLATWDIPWKGMEGWHSGGVVTRFQGLQAQSTLEPGSIAGNLWFRAPHGFIQ